MSPAQAYARVDKLAAAFRWMVVVVTVLIVYVGWFSWSSRRDAARASRRRCEAAVVERITARDESLASERANLVVAGDRTQSHRTRIARWHQAQSNRHAAEVRERSLPRRVRRTTGGRAAPDFSCAAVYPDPSLVPWAQ